MAQAVAISHHTQVPIPVSTPQSAASRSTSCRPHPDVLDGSTGPQHRTCPRRRRIDHLDPQAPPPPLDDDVDEAVALADAVHDAVRHELGHEQAGRLEHRRRAGRARAGRRRGGPRPRPRGRTRAAGARTWSLARRIRRAGSLLPPCLRAVTLDATSGPLRLPYPRPAGPPRPAWCVLPPWSLARPAAVLACRPTGRDHTATAARPAPAQTGVQRGRAARGPRPARAGARAGGRGRAAGAARRAARCRPPLRTTTPP